MSGLTRRKGAISMTAKKRSKTDATPNDPTTSDTDNPQDAELEDEPASAIKRGKTVWFVKDKIEAGTVCIFQGAKGAGKSTWLRAIAASVTSGKPLPGDKTPFKLRGGVLWYAGEENKSIRVVPGLASAGADLSKIFVSDRMSDNRERQLALPMDCERLERRIRFRSAKLVVVDPVFCFLDGTCDLEGPTEPARRFMASLQRVAQGTGCVIALTRNLTKDTSRGALASGRGGGELGNAARSCLHCQPLPGEAKHYGLAVVVCNAGQETPTITYRIRDQNGAGVINVTGWNSISADELSGGDDADLDRSLLEKAKLLIKALISDGKMESKIVKDKADKAMISTRTMQQAAKLIGVEYRRSGSREATVSYWARPAKGWKE
jgi:energy-coupling factor transporter ATP-binding protein EcfA2